MLLDGLCKHSGGTAHFHDVAPIRNIISLSESIVQITGDKGTRRSGISADSILQAIVNGGNTERRITR